jgi:stearoyl-CoA desaturase (delta-9 desaturase)
MFNRSLNSICWPNAVFLIGTLALALTATPAYLWWRGPSWFQAGLFLFFFAATSLSITLGYHRLFTHRSFQARWPVRLFTLLFGAGAFEGSVLTWAADHRRHHKFVDQEEDPYDITKGFFHAHIGWLLRRDERSSALAGVSDLQRDALVRWQHRYVVPLALLVCFGLPSAVGALWGGWPEALGALLIAGVARVVLVSHMTFFINSWSHIWGRRPYSNQCTARDNAVLAWLTFGEGYHNFHHAFQYDYRNGVKAWQFDPTKWCIWLLHQVGLARGLRRAGREKILLAEVAEQQRQLAAKLSAAPNAEPIHSLLQGAHARVLEALRNWARHQEEYRRAAERKVEASREKLAELAREFRLASAHLRLALREWRKAQRLAQARLA